jgi:hypothetical protein
VGRCVALVDPPLVFRFIGLAGGPVERARGTAVARSADAVQREPGLGIEDVQSPDSRFRGKDIEWHKPEREDDSLGTTN